MNHISLTVVEMPFSMVVEKRVPPPLQPVPAPSPQAARPFLPHLDGTASVLRPQPRRTLQSVGANDVSG